MTFARTYNYELARSIMTHARVYPHITDDYSPNVNSYRPLENEALWYVLVSGDEGELLGLFLFVPENAICWSVHTCLLPKAWGPMARRAGREMAGWIWENTLCHRIVTSVPESNRLALEFAVACGMTEYGRNEKSILKGGKLQDQVCLGISRPIVISASRPTPAEEPQEV